MSSSVPAAGTWVPSRRWRWACRQPAQCWPWAKPLATGRLGTQYPVPLRDQGTWGAPAGLLVAAQHKLPAVYYRRYYVASGGLISYGYDLFDQYRRAAGYVDRILKGEKPADLPVQAPTRYSS